MADELDLAQNTRLFVMDVASFDSSDGLDAAEGRFGRLQGSKALTVAEQPFHGRMITLYQIVSPLSVEVSNAINMRIIPMIDFANNATISLGHVGHNCYGSV